MLRITYRIFVWIQKSMNIIFNDNYSCFNHFYSAFFPLRLKIFTAHAHAHAPTWLKGLKATFTSFA